MEEQLALPATLLADSRQKRLALIIAMLVPIPFIAIIPIGHIQLPRVDSYIPVVDTVILINDSITATLLLAHFSITRAPSLLALAAGFLFTALLIIPHALTLPGAFAPDGLLGAVLQTPAWLNELWHLGLPSAVITYALLKRAGSEKPMPRGTAGFAIFTTVTSVLAVTWALLWLTTKGVDLLPPIMVDMLHSNAPWVFAPPVALSIIALSLLWPQRHLLLNLTLLVVLEIWMFDALLFYRLTTRYSLLWYGGRAFATLAASLVLLYLLSQTTVLYARLARSNKSLRRSEQHQRLLTAELDHRVKNILAQVAAVATSTRQGSRSIDDFTRSLGGRIQSMAAAHTLLSKSGWRNVGLDALVRTELAPYTSGTNVKISGTDIMLTSAETQALAKVLHELATNAAKYGALSIPDGQVSVGWGRKPNGRAATLMLEWRELGGPPVASEAQTSYGTNLIRNLIPHELGGTVDLMFAAEGASCKIEFPIEKF